MIKSLIQNLFKCRHKNALINSNEGYCPDCGKYLKKSYYIVRCKHCDIKRIAKRVSGEIAPVEKFCKNCGGNEFVVEKYERLNLVDINYAIEIKEEVETGVPINDLEIWIDKEPVIYKEKEQDKQSPTKQIPIITTKYIGAN